MIYFDSLKNHRFPYLKSNYFRFTIFIHLSCFTYSCPCLIICVMYSIDGFYKWKFFYYSVFCPSFLCTSQDMWNVIVVFDILEAPPPKQLDVKRVNLSLASSTSPLWISGYLIFFREKIEPDRCSLLLLPLYQ